MYYLKNILFNELTKNQKASLMTFLKSFTKKHSDKSTQEILDLFMEDEQYYYEQKNPHFEWIIEEFEKDAFIKEVIKYITECKKQLDLKEPQKPFLEKQKELMKIQKKKNQEYLMGKQEPTKKQLYYYDKLCKKHHIEPEQVQGLSRLDLKNMIGKILDDADSKKID